MPRWSQIIAILRESFSFALISLKNNLLRTLLSTLAIIIGIFTIISILTFITSLNKTIKDSVSELGGDILYIQKWPWLFQNDYPWWKFINRPEMSYNEFLLLEKKSNKTECMAMIVGIYGKSIASEKEQVKNAYVAAITHDYLKLNSVKIGSGRYFTEYESETGAAKIILGSKIAQVLFNAEEPLEKFVKILGKKFHVIGILEKKGQGGLDFNDNDNIAIITMNYARYLFGSGMKNMDVTVQLKPNKKTNIDELENEVRGIMRSVRRLKPADEDNFAINRASFISDKLSEIFRSLSLMGWIIAAFSILVGGFGTANIMFVSVKERTFLIGIEKALGAPRYFILIQFLGESVILCLFGGLVGLVLVLILVLIANSVQNEINLILTPDNALIGIGLSTLIGVVAGFIPSWQASRLDPVEAIRNVF